MPPLPDITAGLASSAPAAQAVFNAFKTPMYFDLGITLGAIVLVFLIVAFKDAIMRLVGRRIGEKFSDDLWRQKHPDDT